MSPLGLEPRSHGLRVRCSDVELEARYVPAFVSVDSNAGFGVHGLRMKPAFRVQPCAPASGDESGSTQVVVSASPGTRTRICCLEGSHARPYASEARIWQVLPESNRHSPFWGRQSSPLNEGPVDSPVRLELTTSRIAAWCSRPTELRRVWRAVLDSNERSPASDAGGMIHYPNGANACRPEMVGEERLERSPRVPETRMPASTPHPVRSRAADLHRSSVVKVLRPEDGRSADARPAAGKGTAPSACRGGGEQRGSRLPTQQLRTAPDGRPNRARQIRPTVDSTAFVACHACI